MMRRKLIAGAMLALLAFGHTPAIAASPEAEKAAILDVIAKMEASWNRSDFRGYMEGFQNPGVIFVSGGKIQDGWQGTLDHYIRDYGGTPEHRGNVHFYNITIDMLGPDAAMLISHYRLQRPDRPQQGINTRLFRKIDGKWAIAMNHVSGFNPEAPPAK